MNKFISLFLILCMIISATMIGMADADADESSRAGSPPSITTTNVLTAYVGKYYSVNYTATDSDTNQSSLVWSYQGNSTWLSFTTSQELKGTPIRSGVCWVNITVTDGSNSDHAVFYVVVKNSASPPSGQPPVITTTNVIEAFVGKKYSVNYTATDADTNQSSLVWNWTTDSTWLSFSSSQELSGTPNATGACWVNITVTDGNNSDYAVFYITVKSGSTPPSNQPPVITTTNVLEAFVGKKYSVNYTATDPDTNQSALIWRWTTNSTWLSFSATQELSGTPTAAGVCWVNISVTDGTSTASAVFYIVVKKSTSTPTNYPPVITTKNVLEAFTGKKYSVNYTATDLDTPQKNLTWSWKTNSTWLSFSSTQELKGTPTVTGLCWVNISVTDGTSYDYAVFYLVVKKSTTTPSNQPPVINTQPARTANVGKFYSVNYTATDPDTPQNKLTWSWKTNSTWLTFSSSQQLSGTPGSTGVCWINITVTDGTSSAHSVAYITVNPSPTTPTNKPPRITTTNILTAYVSKLYMVNYSASDPDTPQKNLTWSWKTNSTWLKFSQIQVLSGTPTRTGVCWVIIYVTDGTSTDSTTFYIVVKKNSAAYPPRIIESSMAMGNQNVPTDTSEVTVEFSNSMNISSVNSALSVSPSLDYSLAWNDDGTELTIRFNNALSKNTDFAISIDTSAEDSDGKNLESEYELDFTTGEGPEADDTRDDHVQETGSLSDIMSYRSMGILAAALAIMIIIVFFLVIRKRRKSEGESTDGRVDMDHSFGITDRGETIEQRVAWQTPSDIDLVLEDARTDALGPTKPSETGLSKENMMDGFEAKFNKGEISEETYSEIKELLSENDDS